MKKRSISFWFWTLLLSKFGNMLVMGVAIFVTVIFIIGGFTEHWLIGLIGVVVFAGYILSRIQATVSYKSLVDSYIDKGYSEQRAIMYADDDVVNSNIR